MSVRTRTLQQLLDGVSDRADINIATSGVRHTQAKVTDRINRSVQRWLLMVAESGDDTNLKSSRTTTSTSTTRDSNNWAPNQYVALPSGAVLIRGMDVWVNATSPVAMLRVDELERNDAQMATTWWLSGGIGMPVFYRVGGINQAGSNLIQIFPWADAVYTIDIRYIPALTDLSGLSDTVDFICGGEEWVINDVAMQTLISDGLAGGAEMGAIAAMNRKLEDELKFTLACRGGLRKVDTRERRRYLQSLSGSPWRLL